MLRPGMCIFAQLVQFALMHKSNRGIKKPEAQPPQRFPVTESSGPVMHACPRMTVTKLAMMRSLNVGSCG